MITRDFLVTGGFNNGYVPKLTSAVIQPVFASANIALRREVLEQVGGFDNAGGTREDADLTLKVAATRWLIFFDERATVQHVFRAGIGELCRQWFRYGMDHAYVLRKHTKPGLEFFARTGANRGMMGYRFPFPIRVFVPLTLFHVFHATLVGTLLAGHWAHPVLAASCGVIAAVTGIRHFLIPFPRRKFKEWAVFLGLRYIMNWSFVIGGFVGGLRHGMLNLEPAHDRNALPDEFDTCT
jgi:cellulose synthase/poly-beta-1,6-N-acetylglucosamine synthase-like glycosyltransferase